VQECGTALAFTVIQSLKRRMKCQVASLTYVVPLTVNGGRIICGDVAIEGSFWGFRKSLLIAK